MSQKNEQMKWPQLPIPKYTTFGPAPNVENEVGYKAYRGWLLVRFAYEVTRWICWTITAAGLMETVALLTRVINPLGT